MDSQLTLFTRTHAHFLTQRKIEAKRTPNRLDREDYFWYGTNSQLSDSVSSSSGTWTAQVALKS